MTTVDAVSALSVRSDTFWARAGKAAAQAISRAGTIDRVNGMRCARAAVRIDPRESEIAWNGWVWTDARGLERRMRGTAV